MNFFLIFSQESRSWGLRTIFFNSKNTWKEVRKKCYQLQHQAMLRNHLALKYSTERNWVTLGRSLCVEPLVYNQTDGMIWFSEQRLWNWMIPWGDKIKLAFWENRAWSFPLGCDRCDYAQPTIRHRHENSLRNRACPILNQGPLYLPNSVVAKTKEPRLKGSINVLHKFREAEK